MRPDGSPSTRQPATPPRLRAVVRRRAAAVLGGAMLVVAAAGAVASATDEPVPPESADDQAVAQSGPRPVRLSQTRLRPDSGFSSVAVTRDGEYALVLGDGALQKVRLTPGEPQVVGITRDVGGSKVVVHPNGRFAYAVGKNGFPIHVVNISKNTPRLVRRIAPNLSASDIALAPKGGWLYVKNGGGYTGMGEPRGLYVFSLAKPGQPKRVTRVLRDEQPGEIAVTRNGKRVITTNSYIDDYLFRYDVSTPRQPKTLGGKRRFAFRVDQIAISPDGRHTYVSGNKRPSDGGPSLMIAKLRTGDLTRIALRGPFLAGRDDLEVRPDSKFVVAAGWHASTDDGLYVFERQPFRRVGTYPDPHPSASGSLAFSYGGATRGRFYQVVDDGYSRRLIASRLVAGP